MLGVPPLTFWRHVDRWPVDVVDVADVARGRPRFGWCRGNRNHIAFAARLRRRSIIGRRAPRRGAPVGGTVWRGRRCGVVQTARFAGRRRRCRSQRDGVLPGGFLPRASGGPPHGDLVPAAAIAFLNDIGLQRQGTDHAMELQEQPARIAQGVTFRVAAPQRRGLGAAVGTCGRRTHVLPVLRSAGAGGTRWRHAAKARLRWRIGG